MRRAILLGVAAAAGTAVIGARHSRGRRASAVVSTGLFPNGMAYAKAGDGPRTAIAIPGGPGNTAPTLRAVGPALSELLADGYTCWAITRRRGMPAGHSVADMADDYASLIDAELGGRVDLLIGTSCGGMIGFYVAARHPRTIGRLAVVGAAARVDDEGRAADLEFARAMADGRLGDASVAILGAVAPHVPRVIARALGPLLMPLVVGKRHATFATDILVEAEASDRYDARDILPSISVPVLVVGADEDRYFPLADLTETARSIPGAILRIHAGQGHMRVISSKAAARDLLEFARAGATEGFSGLDA